MPELSHLDVDEKRRILKSTRANRNLFGIYVLGALFGSMTTKAVLVSEITSSAALLYVAAATAGCAVAVGYVQVQMFRARSAMRLHIMDVLVGKCVPVCLKCGYDQAGNTTLRCPECGSTILVPSKRALGT